MFTRADAREYARLVRELDGRSLSRARRPLFGAGPGVDAPQTPATIEWRARRAHQRPEVDAELRLAREWLRLRTSGALPVEAVRAARRCGDGLEFLVREQGALGDECWAEARLNERLARAGGTDGARLTAETQRAREAPVPQCTAAWWLLTRGIRRACEWPGAHCRRYTIRCVRYNDRCVRYTILSAALHDLTPHLLSIASSGSPECRMRCAIAHF